MDAPYKVAQLLQGRLGLLVGLHDQVLAPARVTLHALATRCQIDGQHNQPLLGAVVQVTLDASALLLCTVDSDDAARLELGVLRGELCVGLVGPSRSPTQTSVGGPPGPR